RTAHVGPHPSRWKPGTDGHLQMARATPCSPALPPALGHGHRCYYTVPIVALAAGRRPAKKLQGVFGNTHIEDLRLPYFCISTNWTRAERVAHRTGPVWQGLRASRSLPGLLPPVAHEGDWLVDGAVLNNLPVDVMHRWCEGGPVIAVDVSASMDMAAS